MNSNLIFSIFSAAGLACATGQFQQPDQPLAPGGDTLRVHRTWTSFLQPRFGFELPIPPRVSAVGNPEAADEPQFQSADQNFVMSAWGGLISELPSKVIADQWNSAQRKANREITYQRRGKTWFVVSGTDVQGMEFYEKFITRNQHVAFLNITFPKSHIHQYESWVERIEDGFRLVALRKGPPEYAQQLSRGQAGDAFDVTPAEQKNPAESTTKTPYPKQESKVSELTSKKLPDIVAPPIAERLLSADKVVGKPGFVYSPFSADHRIVDVVGVPSGTKVKCPYTLKNFRVP